VDLPGLLHAAFVRSPHAHARVLSINTERAASAPGVVGLFTHQSLERWMRPCSVYGAPSPALGEQIEFVYRSTTQYPLARDRVRYVGEPVAVVIAENRYLAEDAAELVDVEYEPLPAALDVTDAGAHTPLLYPEWGDNVAAAFRLSVGEPEQAFQRADVVVRERFTVQRCTGMPMEARAVVASYERRDGSLVTWNSTQVPHVVQMQVADLLGLPMHKVRVIAPDVGGGFGTKASTYVENVLVPLIARVLGRPVKWVEDRREFFVATAHARDQVHDIALAARRDGTILAMHDRFWVDLGAYNPWGLVLPYNTAAHLAGPLAVPNLLFEVTAAVTNKTPNAPYRGAGRPEAVFAVDRILDRLARELSLDPADLRRRNYVRAEAMPYDTGMLYRDGHPMVYDSGDFPATLEAALRAVGYEQLRAEQLGLQSRAVYRGLGISGYVEGTGIGPFESARVHVDLTGRVLVATGACSQGQGHETTFAQIATDALGVPLDWVSVVEGDTLVLPVGVGTYASRGAVTAGNAVAQAAEVVREKVLAAAAELLETAPSDLVLEEGVVSVRGLPRRRLTLQQVVQAALPTLAGSGTAEQHFEATVLHHVPTVTYASAVHVAHVEVDPETGRVQLLGYAVAHDAGRIINPLVVDGQVCGGVAQGIGGALLEEIVHDESGQVITASLMDYLVPTALDVPELKMEHLEYPSPRNPLGVKGLGEGGAISPPAAIANAVEDALRPFGVRVTSTPLSPSRVQRLIRDAQAGAGQFDRR
jgi:carbon-monoxide dehydrogenase large subunit